MKLRIRRIEKPQDFMALAPIWAQLAKENGQQSPFLSYDWFWCCWHGVWPQYRPEILLIEDSGGPVAIVPLMHWRGWVFGLPVRYVGFLECPSTPWADVLTVGEHNTVIETVLDHLASRSDWNIAWLRKLPAGSPTLKALVGILPDRFLWCRAGYLRYPFLAIEGDWGHFIDAKNPFIKDFCQRVQDQLQRAGDIDFEEHRTIHLQSPFLQEVVATMSRCQPDSSIGVATMPRTLEFFRELTRRAAKNSWLSLWSLRLNGHIIALEYQLRFNGEVHALWTGDDTSCHKFLPRKALQAAILQSLFLDGHVYEYNLGPGIQDDSPWWATAHHETVHLKIYRPGLYSCLLQRQEAVDLPGVRK
jgi:Acetyltransferase (GNAT) domain